MVSYSYMHSNVVDIFISAYAFYTVGPPALTDDGSCNFNSPGALLSHTFSKRSWFKSCCPMILSLVEMADGNLISGSRITACLIAGRREPLYSFTSRLTNPMLVQCHVATTPYQQGLSLWIHLSHFIVLSLRSVRVLVLSV